MIGNILDESSLKELLGNEGIIKNGYSEYIPLDKLIPCGFNTFEIEDIETLVREIKVAGLITPLTVIGPDNKEMYRILSGERRYHALRRIHEEDHTMYETVSCFICGSIKMDETAQKLIMELANVSVRKIDEIPHRFAIVKLLKKLSDDGYMNRWNIGSNLAEYLGVAPNYARCYKNVIYADNSELEQMVVDKMIDIKLAAILTKFDKDELEQFLTRVKHGENAWKIYRTDYQQKKEQPAVQEVKQIEENVKDLLDEHISSDLEDDYQESSVMPPEQKESPDEERVIIPPAVSIPTKTKEQIPTGNKSEEVEKKAERKPIPTFDSSIFSTEKLKDIFNDYTGSNFEEAIQTETKVSHQSDSNNNVLILDYHRIKKDLRILLEKEELSLEDEEIIELCREIIDKFDIY